ncbi:MAG: DNA repair exonuclease [Eubacteriales bacterium]|nr:DNA repair exonuclease [Eubacteriales bacterium]
MRFIHIADVHLGAVPDKGYSWSGQRGEEIWRSFRKLLDEAENQQTDFLLIAGDLFHQPPTLRELREANYLFGKLSHTQVVLIAGNHDFLGEDSPEMTFQWNENVVFLDKEYCECVYFEGFNTYIYGFSYHRREITDPLYDELRPDQREGCHILLAHGGDEHHIPFNKKKLEKNGFDYIALGHIHKPQELITNRMAYAGALEPIDVNDVGPHGYIAGEFENGKIHTEFVEFASRSYVHLELESDAGTTSFAMQEQIEEALREHGDENIYRIKIKGFRSPDIRWNTRSWMNMGNILDIRDDSKPDYDLEEIYRVHKDDIIGRYIEKLLGNEKQEMREKSVRMRAVYYGIHALMKEI